MVYACCTCRNCAVGSLTLLISSLYFPLCLQSVFCLHSIGQKKKLRENLHLLLWGTHRQTSRKREWKTHYPDAVIYLNIKRSTLWQTVTWLEFILTEQVFLETNQPTLHKYYLWIKLNIQLKLYVCRYRLVVCFFVNLFPNLNADMVLFQFSQVECSDLTHQS